jgi:WD40 repeat protein
VQSGRELQRCEGHTDQIWKFAVTPDGRRVVSGGKDKVLRVWRLLDPPPDRP